MSRGTVREDILVRHTHTRTHRVKVGQIILFDKLLNNCDTEILSIMFDHISDRKIFYKGQLREIKPECSKKTPTAK